MPGIDNWTGCVGEVWDKRISDLKESKRVRNTENYNLEQDLDKIRQQE
jgi:hypothetical protein